MTERARVRKNRHTMNELEGMLKKQDKIIKDQERDIILLRSTVSQLKKQRGLPQ